MSKPDLSRLPGFAIDVKNLLNLFRKKQSPTFGHFKEVWKFMQFSTIHECAPHMFEAEYFQSVASTFLAYLLMYPDGYVRSGVIFGLYCLYNTQKGTKQRIKIDLTIWRELMSTVNHLHQQEALEPCACFEHMTMQRAFTFCSQVRFGVTCGDMFVRDQRNFPNPPLSADLMRMDTVSHSVDIASLKTSEKLYNESKNAFIIAMGNVDGNMIPSLTKSLGPTDVSTAIYRALAVDARQRPIALRADGEQISQPLRLVFPPLEHNVGNEFVNGTTTLQEIWQRTTANRVPRTRSSRAEDSDDTEETRNSRQTPSTSGPAFSDSDSDAAQDMPSFSAASKRPASSKRPSKKTIARNLAATLDATDVGSANESAKKKRPGPKRKIGEKTKPEKERPSRSRKRDHESGGEEDDEQEIPQPSSARKKTMNVQSDEDESEEEEERPKTPEPMDVTSTAPVTTTATAASHHHHKNTTMSHPSFSSRVIPNDDDLFAPPRPIAAPLAPPPQTMSAQRKRRSVVIEEPKEVPAVRTSQSKRLKELPEEEAEGEDEEQQEEETEPPRRRRSRKRPGQVTEFEVFPTRRRRSRSRKTTEREHGPDWEEKVAKARAAHQEANAGREYRSSDDSDDYDRPFHSSEEDYYESTDHDSDDPFESRLRKGSKEAEVSDHETLNVDGSDDDTVTRPKKPAATPTSAGRPKKAPTVALAADALKKAAEKHRSRVYNPDA